jgi:hypothetical protein
MENIYDEPAYAKVQDQLKTEMYRLKNQYEDQE